MLFCTVHFRTRLEAYLDVSHGSKISSGVCLVVVWKLLKICLQWKICSGQTPMKTQNLERNIINHVKWNQRITSFFFPTTKTTSNWITSSKRHHAHKSYIWSSMIIIINFFPLKCSFERDRHTHTPARCLTVGVQVMGAAWCSAAGQSGCFLFLLILLSSGFKKQSE